MLLLAFATNRAFASENITCYVGVIDLIHVVHVVLQSSLHKFCTKQKGKVINLVFCTISSSPPYYLLFFVVPCCPAQLSCISTIPPNSYYLPLAHVSNNFGHQGLSPDLNPILQSPSTKLCFREYYYNNIHSVVQHIGV